MPPEYKNIELLLESFLGKSKNGLSESGQLQFACPKCIEEKGHAEESKFNLEVNLKKLVFKCWSCSTVDNSMEGRLSKLIKKYGNSLIYGEYRKQVEGLVKSKEYDISEFAGKPSDISDSTIITLPETFTKIDIDRLKDNRLISYLSKRKITQDIIDKFNIGYTGWDESIYGMKNRIIIPSYDSFGYLNYWTGRDFTGQSKTKYRNCDADKNKIIFQESTIDFDADIVLCEGAIDCIYGLNTISMLGKTLKPNSKLYSKLMNSANSRIIICLDSDTTVEETKRIYKILNRGRLEGKIWYIALNNFKDFGEIYEAYGKKGIINTVRSARQFNEIELIIN